ncbi:MAG: ATP-binding protein [Chloroflexi bacterium]|nr:ATP-binding protein [Chloroflexota bacterium]MBU1750632.1 ATP-binding protein [Chloroflexota bacterium]
MDDQTTLDASRHDRHDEHIQAGGDVAYAPYGTVHITTGPAAGGTPAPPCRSTLPHQPFFFGRDKELDTIAEAIVPEARTWGALIDGPGGIGKTALAVRAGHLAPAHQFPRKVFLSAKARELTPAGERPLADFMLPNYMALLNELARELDQEGVLRLDPSERAAAVRRALADTHALLIIDNVESLDEPERVRLYQFLSRLPLTCKAIVTSRRRTDIDARVVRLDRLLPADALDLIAELAQTNRHLARADEQARTELYELTNGNPLLIRWVAGQLGRPGSHCRTIPQACAYMKNAPPGNDPLEFVFGDLLDTFTESESQVLAALTHFTQPAKVEWIAELAELAPPAAQTTLEDLADRALLVSDEAAEAFLLPPLSATFLRRQRPEAVAQAGSRLTSSALALVLENGWDHYERFPTLEAAWLQVAAALPLFLAGDNARLQRLCNALYYFLEFSGRWDEWRILFQQAEEKAIAAGDSYNAGWRRTRREGGTICAGKRRKCWPAPTAARSIGSAPGRGRGHLPFDCAAWATGWGKTTPPRLRRTRRRWPCGAPSRRRART